MNPYMLNTKSPILETLSSSRGSYQRRRRKRVGRNKRKTSEDEKPNPPGKRSRMEQMLQNPCQQKRILLHQLSQTRHQYHFSLSSFCICSPAYFLKEPNLNTKDSCLTLEISVQHLFLCFLIFSHFDSYTINLYMTCGSRWRVVALMCRWSCDLMWV